MSDNNERYRKTVELQKLMRDPAAVMALIAENERLAAKIEQVRSRSVSLDYSKDAVIPNALDAWGRVVPQHLPYDFSGNPGASATQYCNGWNDAGGYWKAHCVDIQSERDQLKAENAGLKTGYEAYEQVVQGLRAEVEALRKALTSSREFLMRDAKVRRMTDKARHISPMFPLRKLVMEQIDAAMSKGEKS